MEFKKDQRVVSNGTGVRYRVESGPWHSCGVGYYLVEALDGGRGGDYALIAGAHLRPAAPKVGDKGHLVEHSGAPMRVIRAINDDYVVCETASGTGNTYLRFVVGERADFDKSWRPQS